MKVSLVATVKNAGPDVGAFIESLRSQTRQPDEVIVVDGGSTDGTVEILAVAGGVTLIEEPGANISRGRNIAVRAATHDVIAVSDADCALDPTWLERLTDAMEEGADVAMGFYRPVARGFFEACVAAATVPEPNELREERFMPSSRSLAFRREIFEAAGGYPEWLDVGEDMYLDHRWRERGARMVLVPNAIAHWPMRSNLGAVWRQYFGYAKGDGIAGMYPQRHALRFSVYAAATASVWSLPRRRWPSAMAAVGAALYARPRVRRAFHLLPSLPERAAGAAAVPALLGFIDAAKMAGYVAGLVERSSVAAKSS